ncbi:hypothetical protein COCVIDRAFT_39353 [Bipolaris victoriae FI3]|uniref:Uncharacterized protein n=1 Tax=Bipolaris victoriae (strain FI3) TaxID=930091 RepID=W7E425_BIPV3|nr:hypothetical protein COCVIDRAFT_39353 [Bipolaris victoriae FI3]
MHSPFALSKHPTTLSMHRNPRRAQPDMARCLCKVYTTNHMYAYVHLADSSHTPSVSSLARRDHATRSRENYTYCQTSKTPTLMTCTPARF